MPHCRVCPECNGVVCKGEVPGMGGKGTGTAFMNNINALRYISLNMKVIHEVRTPDISCEVLGENLSLPVMAAPMTGTGYSMGGRLSDEEFTRVLVEGCEMAGTLASVGDGESPDLLSDGLRVLHETRKKAAVFIKPWNNDEFLLRSDRLDRELVPFMGSDLDGCGLTQMNTLGFGVYPKTMAELKSLIDSIDIPFIVKGVLTLADAEAAYAAGAKGIVVSNHGGRVLDHARPTADVLPEIARQMKGRLTIMVDGGVRDGVDVFKMLALGADVVLIGRPFVTYAFGGGKEGVAMYVEKLKQELTSTMLLTGAATIKDITPEMILRY